MKNALNKFHIFTALVLVTFISCNDKNDGEDLIPTACFDYSPSINITEGTQINFNNCSENADSYNWNFGDGNELSIENPNHIFNQEGEYKVVLTARNNDGVDSIAEMITVLPNTNTEPIAYYPFNSNADDASGNSNNGTSNATLTENRFGAANSAFYFDGVDDFVTIDNELIGGLQKGTVLGWFNYQEINQEPSQQPIISFTDNNGDMLYFGIYDNNGLKLSFGVFGSEWFWAISPNNAQTDQWHHFAGSWGEEGVKLYIDGVLIASNEFTGGLGTETTNIEIGRNFWGDFTNTIIDDIRIYNRILNSEEINELYTLTVE